jgi:hypothetical protein
MRIAILVDELPTSSAPKIVGEEAFHLAEFEFSGIIIRLYEFRG